MAKRKITVTVDEELVETVQALGAGSLSAVVNAALLQEVERRGRAAALARLLADWDAAYGPVGAEAVATAEAVFDDLDAVAVESAAAPARRRRRGAA